MQTWQPKLRLVVAGGGTGGHLFPAIAVAQEFQRRLPLAEIVFIGTSRQLDRGVLDHYGFISRTIRSSPLKGGSLGRKIRTLLTLPVSLVQAGRILHELKPALVFGVGGYVTGPVILAAKILGLPAFIHEQNSVPGLANRRLGAFVDRIFLSIPGSERYFDPAKCSLHGNPVRRDILAAAPGATVAGQKLVVVGGSQGAHRINVVIPEALAIIRNELPAGFHVVHQTGKADQEAVSAAYAKAGIPAEVSAFIQDMAGLYRDAALVIARAGATTLAELTALGKPAVLIPYPFAADDHQRKNGEYLVAAGAAIMMLEGELQAAALARELQAILTDRQRRQLMSDKAGRLAKLQAAERIVDECLQIIGMG